MTKDKTAKRVKTKEKILATALSMFNEQGISAVSSRSISEEMGISYGNLCYHFPKKNSLILQLYLNMQAELDEEYTNIQKEILGFDFMVKSLRSLLEVLYKYRFIYLDNTFIVRKFDNIRSHAVLQFERRKEMLRGITDFLTKEEYMRVDLVEGHNERLIHSILILLNSWISDAEIFFKGEESEKIDYYLELLYSTMRPSLTKKGLQAFDEVYKGRLVEKGSSRIKGS